MKNSGEIINMNKIEIIKTRINAPTKILTAKWTIDEYEMEPLRKKPETVEEEADEIVYRLKSQPKKRLSGIHQYDLDLEKELGEILSKIIAEEIDREI